MAKTDPTKDNDSVTGNEPPKRGAEHQRMEVFIGTWKTAGQQLEGPVGPAAKVTATETYEWAIGRFFLVHHFEGRVGSGETACVEIIGCDPESHTYPVHSYYNNGVTNQWRYRERDGTWTLTGDWKTAGQSMKVRCTTMFSNDGNAMTSKWEQFSGAEKWETFWDLESTRAA